MTQPPRYLHTPDEHGHIVHGCGHLDSDAYTNAVVGKPIQINPASHYVLEVNPEHTPAQRWADYRKRQTGALREIYHVTDPEYRHKPVLKDIAITELRGFDLSGCKIEVCDLKEAVIDEHTNLRGIQIDAASARTANDSFRDACLVQNPNNRALKILFQKISEKAGGELGA